MRTRPKFLFVPRNFAVIALVGHVGGAALLALPGAVFGGAVVVGAAFAGAALGGLLGVFLGIVVLSSEDEFADVSTRVALPPRLPWAAVGGGVAASVAVCVVSFAGNFERGGFLEGSPCEYLSGVRGAHLTTIETLLPAQYTCVYSGGTLPLIPPGELAALSLLAMAGAAAIGWGLWRLRGARATGMDAVFRIPIAAVGLFLAVDAVAGAVVLAGQVAGR